jgi:Lon protease-like protein
MSFTSGVFPLGTAYLPGEKVVLRVFESRYLELMNDIGESDYSFLSVLIEQGSEVGGGDRRFSHGVRIKVENIFEADVGLVVEARAQERIKVLNWHQQK